MLCNKCGNLNWCPTRRGIMRLEYQKDEKVMSKRKLCYYMRRKREFKKKIKKFLRVAGGILVAAGLVIMAGVVGAYESNTYTAAQMITGATVATATLQIGGILAGCIG